jgi:hypothetical protein
MTPATHAAVGAAISGAVPRLWLAIPAAFASHFLLDAIFHFEAFYPLSRAIGTSHDEAFVIALLGAAAAMVPAVWWVARKDRELAIYCVYLLALVFLWVEEDQTARLAMVLAVTAGVLGFSRSARIRRWTICGFAAVLPDLIRKLVPTMARFHNWVHVSDDRGLGDLTYRLLVNAPPLFVGDRFANPAYLLGYFLEIVIEAAILLAALWWAGKDQQRRLDPVEAAGASAIALVADLPAIDHQTDSRHE